MSEVKANRVADRDSLKEAGDYHLIEDANGAVTHIAYLCPCGRCNRFPSALPIDLGDQTGRPKWQWNGDKNRPTLTPSIQRRLSIQGNAEHGIEPHECNWHGFLTDGVFKSC